MADPEEGIGGPGPPLFLDKTEAQRAEKKSFLRVSFDLTGQTSESVQSPGKPK